MPHRLVGSLERRDAAAALESIWRLLDPAGFLSSPDDLDRRARGAALIGAAIQLRMRRAESEPSLDPTRGSRAAGNIYRGRAWDSSAGSAK